MAACWQTLLVDSYDGRIDHAYPVHCYDQAIAHLPLTLRLYSTERDDILRALQRRIGPSSSSVIVEPRPPAGTGGHSLPIPLLVLGSVAVLLVVVGVGGAAWRRFRPSSRS